MPVFTCCHPALAVEAQVALTLRTLGGLSTDAIARALLVPERTMAQRLVRAKRKIKAVDPVIAVLYGELSRLSCSPVVELNRAIAVAETDGPPGGGPCRRRESRSGDRPSSSASLGGREPDRSLGR